MELKLYPSKLVLILDNDKGIDISVVPRALLPFYLEEMELHVEEVFKVKIRDDWEEE